MSIGTVQSTPPPPLSLSMGGGGGLTMLLAEAPFSGGLPAASLFLEGEQQAAVGVAVVVSLRTVSGFPEAHLVFLVSKSGQYSKSWFYYHYYE